MHKQKLASIAHSLKKYGFVCRVEHQNQDVPFDRLVTSLGLDYKGRERTLVMRMGSFPLPLDISTQKREGTEEHHKDESFLQLYVAFPFPVRKTASGEVARLLMYINKPLEMPGFGLDEINHLVFFRYSLLCTGGMVKSRPLVAILGSVMLLVDALTPQIEAVAEGQPMRKVLESTLKTFTGYPHAA